jgi:DNA-binding Lrp family transcriptional regulator
MIDSMRAPSVEKYRWVTSPGNDTASPRVSATSRPRGPASSAPSTQYNATFEASLATIPRLTEAYRVTGEYDYQLRLSCTDTTEFERIVDVLKRDHGVREVRSRLVLHAIPMPGARILDV